jgi:hypothetical protein
MPWRVADQQARSAYDLKKAWGEGLVLKMVDDAGHSAKEPGTRKLLVEVSLFMRGTSTTSLTHAGRQRIFQFIAQVQMSSRSMHD